MERIYPKLDIEPFGKHLLDSNDLDPVYVALNKAQFPTDQLYRWLLAYWCFYDCGQACYMSELTGDDFWKALYACAVNTEPSPLKDRWKRGHERRHCRGAQGFGCIEGLEKRYGKEPERFVKYVCLPGQSFEDISKRAREHYLFGPWIGFKVSDMTERVLGIPVTFPLASLCMFKDPVEAAIRLWRHKYRVAENVRPKDTTSIVDLAVTYLCDEFKEYKAPPRYDRPFNMQEAETVLCKWKSHQNGHYPLNCDIDAIRGGLRPWADLGNSTAQKFWECMP